MPLAEEQRLKLDGIVNQMIQNKESDENIRFVVNDFKSKYEGQISPLPTTEPSWGESLKKGFGLDKAIGFGEQVISPIISPIKTLKGLGEMGKQMGGGFEPVYDEKGKLRGFKKVGVASLPTTAERWKEPKKTLTEDPAGGYGMLADVSALTSGVGGLAGKTSTVGKIAGGVGEFTNPISWPGKVAKTGRELIGKTGIPESIYARSMKIPPGSLREENRASVINTLVRDEKLPLGKATRTEINSIVEEIDNGITNTLDNLSSTGSKFNIDTVSTALDNLKDNFNNRPNPKQYYNVIDKVKKDFIQHSFVNNGKITLSDAQALKKGTYTELEQYYAKGIKPETGRVGIKNDVEAAAKAKAASTLRNAILNNTDVPDSVRMDLSREAGLMAARKWVERAANRGQNLDPISLGGMAFGILVEGGVPGAVAYKIATSQVVQSRLAIFLAHGSETLRKAGEIAKPVGLGSYQVGKIIGMEE